MTDISKFLVTEEMSVRDALSRLDVNALGVLLLVDSDNQFRRTITDGDLRRLLLDGADMEAAISSLPDIESITVARSEAPARAYSLMREHGIRHVPVLDDSGSVIDLRMRDEVDNTILLSIPHLSNLEQEYVAQAFDTNWIAPLGPNVDGFEEEMAAYLGLRQTAALSSGTAALHLSLVVLDIGPGDIVFCPSLTFIASANPILYQHATPVFIDCAPGSWNMCPDALERAFEQADRGHKLPKAVIVVNLYGYSADYERLGEICQRYGVPIVEDAAESLGATYRGKASGTFGEMSVLSFNGNKIITTSGGGMLVSDNDAYIERVRWLSTQAKDEANYYLHTSIGYNYRMSNVLAGIGRGQLKVLPDRVKARRAIYARYHAELSDIEQIEWIEELPDSTSTHWLSVVLLGADSGSDPDSFTASLASQGIEARRVWNPMHRQPLFASADMVMTGTQSNSDDMFNRGVCLPSSSSLTDDELSRIISAVRNELT